MDLHDIARQVATTAGADFAFVLSQAGLLVTHDAPRDMPDRGRMKILWACPAGKSGEVAHVEMAREDLVPFGGAAPIDVFATRVEDTAILVAVMSSWNDKGTVVLALTAGAAQLAEMIRKAKRDRAQKSTAKKVAGARKERASALPAEPARKERVAALPAEPVRKERAGAAPVEGRRERTTIPFEPVRKERTSAVPAEPKRKERTSAVPAEGRRERTTIPFEPLKRERVSSLPKKPVRPRIPSEPEIEIGEAEVGRETMLVLDAFRPLARSEPEITVGVAEVGRETMLALDAFRPRARSEPEITVGEADVGRETLVAIDASLPRSKAGPAPDGMRVQLDSISRESMLEVERIESSRRGRPTVDEPLVTERRTLPWVDSPASLKRTMEAREAARGAAAPDVKLGVEEMDPEALEQALREGR